MCVYAYAYVERERGPQFKSHQGRVWGGFSLFVVEGRDLDLPSFKKRRGVLGEEMKIR